MRGQQVARQPLFYLKNLIKLTVNLHHKTYDQFLVGNTLLKGDFKNTKTYQNLWGQQVVRPLLFLPRKI